MFRGSWVGETDSCSAPGVEVSGGTDRSLLGVDEFQDYSVQQRDGQGRDQNFFAQPTVIMLKFGAISTPLLKLAKLVVFVGRLAHSKVIKLFWLNV